VKHGGGGVMIWAFPAATRPGHPAVIELTINSFLYHVEIGSGKVIIILSIEN